MATNLQTLSGNPGALISSPDLKRLRRISLGTVQWPGQTPRKYLSDGSTLTESERDLATALLRQLRDAAVAGPSTDQERFGLLAKLLLTYPVANASSESGKARGEAYREALNDIPPAVLAEAIKRWNRGEAGQEHDYRWAPAPAVLRAVCKRVTSPLLDAIHDLEALLGAVSIEEAMEPTKADPTVPMLRRIG